MPLSNEQVEELLRQIGLTKDEEINCDECLLLVAEFAERRLAAGTVPEGLEAIEQHLALCGECREEYEMLQQALQDLDD